MPRCNEILVGTILAAVAMPSAASAAEEIVGSEALAMGGAAVAASQDNASISVNPGLLGLHRRYDFQGHFRLGPEGALQWAGSAVDGRTVDAVGVGVAYSGDRWSPDLLPSERPPWMVPGERVTNVKRLHDLVVGIGVPFANRRMSIGINGALAIYSHDRQGRGTTGNADLGFGWRPENWITLGLVGRNLLPLEDEVVERDPGALAGVRLTHRDLGALALDGGWVHSRRGVPVVVSTGFERTFQFVQFRGGWNYQGPDTASAVTLGLGAGKETTLAWAISVPLAGEGSIWPQLTNQLSLRITTADEDERGP